MKLKTLTDFPERLEEWESIARMAGVGNLAAFQEEILRSLQSNSFVDGIAYFLENDKGSIVATGFLKETVFDTDISCTIFHVAVLPEVRGTGIGKKLMNDLFAEAKTNGKNIVLLFTTTASAFYVACGMSKLGTIPDMVDGEARHFFYRNISAPV